MRKSAFVATLVDLLPNSRKHLRAASARLIAHLPALAALCVRKEIGCGWIVRRAPSLRMVLLLKRHVELAMHPLGSCRGHSDVDLG
jgi:hypothetical protein